MKEEKQQLSFYFEIAINERSILCLCKIQHHQMANTEVRLIIFFAAKDGEALYNQQKQDWELTVVQITELLISKFRLKLK